jgi:hypothetical protein
LFPAQVRFKIVPGIGSVALSVEMETALDISSPGLSILIIDFSLLNFIKINLFYN